jgi:hypothetical protein
LKIAQRFNAGFGFPPTSKVPSGTAEIFFRPSGTRFLFHILNPELKLWAIFKAFNARNRFHNFEIVPVANDYQASFAAARRNFCHCGQFCMRSRGGSYRFLIASYGQYAKNPGVLPSQVVGWASQLAGPISFSTQLPPHSYAVFALERDRGPSSEPPR